MIVRLIVDHTYRNVPFKKGTEIVVSKTEAIELCNDGIAVTNMDIPCEKRNAKQAKEKEKKASVRSKKSK